MKRYISYLHTDAKRWLMMTLLLLSMGIQASAKVPDTNAPNTYAITNVSVIDVVHGGHKVMDLKIEGDRIAAMGLAGSLSLPEHTQVIDASGHYAMPGLWDAHAHIVLYPEDAQPNAELYITQGVTSLRDMGGELDDILALRRYSEKPDVVAPRLFIAGPIIDGSPRLNDGKLVKGDLGVEVNTPEEAIAMVDKLAESGVDFIKPYQFLRPEVFKALVTQARHHGLPLAGHIPSRMTIAEVLALTPYDIQHIAGNMNNVVFDGVKGAIALPDRTAILAERHGNDSAADLLGRFHREAPTVHTDDMDSAKMAVIKQQIIDTGAWYTPTLGQATGFEFLGVQDDPYFRDNDRYRCKQKRSFIRMLRMLRTAKDGQPVDPHELREQKTWKVIFNQRRAMAAFSMRWVHQVYQAGVPLLAGGENAAAAGFNMHLELQALVKAGLSPLAALQTATLNPARYFGITDQLGTIAVGKLADLVIVDKDPLVDIANTRRIQFVISKGQLLDRQRLDQVLEGVVEACRDQQ